MASEVLHSQAGQLVLEKVFVRHRRLHAGLDAGKHRGRRRARDPAAGRGQAPDLWTIRGSRLCGSGRAGPASRGQPADLRLRRPRTAAQGEAEQVERDFVATTGVDLKVVDAADRFLSALAGVTEPRPQGYRPGVHSHVRGCGAGGRGRNGRRGISGSGHSVSRCGRVRRRRKARPSESPVGGLPDDLQFSLIEPLRTLFKDEVRGG